MKNALHKMGYQDATPIQAEAIPLMLQGLDVIGRARTGTGKTAAFGVPMIDGLSGATAGHGVIGLVLVPTRELALQVHGVLQDLATGTRLQVTTAFGGTGFQEQINKLTNNKATILVACPGRLLDLVDRGVADLSNVQVLVLDEADRMLDMGFIHDVRKILAFLPDRRQNALFSATLDQRVRDLAARMLNDPMTVEVESGPMVTDLTEQYQVRLDVPEKMPALLNLLNEEVPHKAVVFTRTKHLAKRMAKNLSKKGWSSTELQGNMTQNQRERSMTAFREGKARILVATDVAARGLDVPDISHVFNFDIPNEPEQYIHRVGRTGRNGATGKAYTFVQSDQVKDFQFIEKLAGQAVDSIAKPQGEAPDGPDPKPVTPVQGDGRKGNPGKGRQPYKPNHARRHPARPGQGRKPVRANGQARRSR